MGTWLYPVQIEKEVQVKSGVLTYVQVRHVYSNSVSSPCAGLLFTDELKRNKIENLYIVLQY